MSTNATIFKQVLLAVAVTGAIMGQVYAQANNPESEVKVPLKETPYIQKADEQMSTIDVDKDSRLSQEEAVAHTALIDRWSEFDVNEDGSIDTTELYLFSAHRHFEVLQQNATQAAK